MNKSPLLTVILLSIIALTSVAHATNYYLSHDTGSDSYNGTSPTFTGGSNGPFLTFGHAVPLLYPGDTLTVASSTSGPYTETNISLNWHNSSTAKITIQAADPSNPPVISEPLGENATSVPSTDAFNIGVGNVSISNITIVGGYIGFYVCANTASANMSNITFNNCTISNTYSAAIDMFGYTAPISDVTIQNCTVFNCGQINEDRSGARNWPTQIIGWVTNNVAVEHCVVHDNYGEGIGPFTDCQNWTISDNTVYDNFSVNIYIDTNLGSMLVQRNFVYDTGKYGTTGVNFPDGIRIDTETVAVTAPALPPPPPTDITVINNIVCGGVSGIRCYSYGSYYIPQGISNGLIANNTIISQTATPDSHAIWFGYSGAPNSNVSIINNLAYSATATGASFDISGPGITASNNYNAGSPALVNPYVTWTSSAPPVPTDYALTATSPCINAGTAVNAPATDFTNNPRYSPPDIGAYEFGTTAGASWIATSGSWSSGANWLQTTSPGILAGTTDADTATFNTIGGGAITVDAGRNLRSLLFDTTAGSFTFNTGPLNLTSGGAIGLLPSLTSSGQTETFTAPIAVEGVNSSMGLFTLSNFSSANSLEFEGPITAVIAGTTLDLDGTQMGPNVISGGIGNTGAKKININKIGAGVWTIAGTNTMGEAGAYVIPNSGTLALDFSDSASPASNIVNAGTRLGMGGGTLQIIGAPATNNSQQLLMLGESEGASEINLDANGASSLVLNLNQAGTGTATQIGVNNGGTIDFTLGSNTSIDYTTSAQASGALLRYSSLLVGTVNGGADWAAENSAGTQIVAGSTISGFYTPSTATTLIGNADAVVTSTTLAANSTAATVRFNTAQNTRISTGSYKMSASGILVTPIFAGNSATISGTIAEAAWSLLDIDQYDTTAGANLTISATFNNVTNAQGWAKNGGGLLTLSTTTNNSAGSAFFNGGIVNMATDTSLGAVPATPTPSDLIFNGGTLQLGANNLTINANRGMTINTNGGTIDTNGYNASYGGIIDGLALNSNAGIQAPSGTFAKAGAGALTISGSNLTSGGISIKAGTLSINTIANGGLQAVTGGTSGSSTVSVLNADGARLAVGQTLSGAPDLIADGTTITNLSVGATYTTVTLSKPVINTDSSLVNYGTPNALGLSTNASTNLSLGGAAGGTLQYTGSAASTDRLFQLNNTAAGVTDSLDASGSASLNFTNPGAITYGTPNLAATLNLTGAYTGTSTLAAAINDNGTGAVSLTKSGSGTWALSGISTYSGSTMINSGTLTISGETSPYGSVTVASGATLNGTGFTGNVTVSSGGSLNLQDGLIDGLTVNSLAASAATPISFDLQTTGTTTTIDYINVINQLTVNTSMTITINNLSGTTTLNSGYYPLIVVRGGASGVVTSGGVVTNITLAGNVLSDGKTLTLVQVGQSIYLHAQ